MRIERITENTGLVTKVTKINTTEITVPYGKAESVIGINTSVRLNKAPRTLSNRERKSLREKNRIGGRSTQAPSFVDGDGVGLEPMIVFQAINVK